MKSSLAVRTQNGWELLRHCTTELKREEEPHTSNPQHLKKKREKLIEFVEQEWGIFIDIPSMTPLGLRAVSLSIAACLFSEYGA